MSKKKSIELIWIVVSDLEKAINFYTEMVGFNLETKEEQFGWAELRGPEGAFLGLAEANEENQLTAGCNAIVTITVDDIIVSKEELEDKGIIMMGDIMEVPGHVKLQLFADADGNLMQLVETLEDKE